MTYLTALIGTQLFHVLLPPRRPPVVNTGESAMLVLPAASLAYLLVGSSQLQEAARNNCLSEFYYGTYGDESVFIPNQECFNKLHMDFASTGTSMVPLGSRPWDDSMLVWLHRAVDGSITIEPLQQEFYDFLVGFATSRFQDDNGQSRLVAPDSHTVQF